MGANEALGLPVDKMQKVLICFDVDGTLIDRDGAARDWYVLLAELMADAFKNAKLVVWSGGGAQYAEQRAREIGLDTSLVWRYASKLEHEHFREMGYWILAIDDIQDTTIGAINLIVRQ